MNSRSLRRWLGRALAVALALGTAGAITRVWAQSRAAERLRAELAHGVDLDERIVLGGVPQWVRLRGRDRTKPALLWLHGGPGFPQLPFAAATADLEREFIVIQWDQRGAGRTFREAPDAELTLARYVADAEELLRVLLPRLGKSDCVLVAHSWGSLVGAELAARAPRLVRCYVGVGQMVSYRAGEQDRYARSLATARARGLAEAERELERVGPPPHLDMDECRVIDRWFARLHPPSLSGPSPWRFVRLACSSPEYGWLDLVALGRGFWRSTAVLGPELYYDIDLADSVSRLPMPVHLLCGEHDRVAPLHLAEGWLAQLEAPRGKQLHRFHASTHWPFLEEPERFCALVVAIAHSAER